MAEPFSIATGAIGVVSLAIQLLHSAYKLRRFFRDVRNAPKELLETITYIDKLVHQLDSIRHEGRRYPGDGPAYDGLATHIKDCEACTRELLGFVNEIYTSTTTKKTWSSIKAVDKKETIKWYNNVSN